MWPDPAEGDYGSAVIWEAVGRNYALLEGGVLGTGYHCIMDVPRSTQETGIRC